MKLTPELKAEFDSAIEQGDTPAVQVLIKNPAILEYLASRYGAQYVGQRTLVIAVQHGHTGIVALLLEIPVVKANAASNSNAALCYAVEKGHTEIVKLLLAIDAVKTNAAVGENFLLRWAATRGHIEIAKLLLAIPRVVNAITVNDHGALNNAIDKSHWDIVLLLLQHYGTNSIPFSLVTKALTIPAQHPAAAGIRAAIFNRVMTVSGSYNTASNEGTALNEWIVHWVLRPWPAGSEINNTSWCDYLFEQAANCMEPKQAAIILLSLNAMAVNHQRHLASQSAVGGGESAMETSLVAMVAKHYAEQVQPTFADKFKALGEVEGVEQHIKWVLLNKIIDNAAEPLKLEIQSRKINILEGVEQDIIWARSKFTAKDDIYHTAWRAYDPGAKLIGWRNLLTAPTAEDANETVFSIAETGAGAVNLKSSTDIIRKMAAHYYLVTMDERLTQDEHEVALESFIAAIAEIRRAHNNDAKTEDNPSCFPGCFTRLHEVSKRNSHITNIKPGLVAALKEIYINELERALTAGYLSCDAAQAYSLYDALCMLSRDNAWDVISKPGKVHCISLMSEDDDSYNPALLKERQAFLTQRLPMDTLMARLQDVLLTKYQIAMEDSDRVLVQALLADVGSGEAAPYIESAYQKRAEALSKSMEAPSRLVRLSQGAVPPNPNSEAEASSTLGPPRAKQ